MIDNKGMATFCGGDCGFEEFNKKLEAENHKKNVIDNSSDNRNMQHSNLSNKKDTEK